MTDTPTQIAFCTGRADNWEADVFQEAGLAVKRKIAAILAADVAGYSRLVAEDEEETLRRLAAYRAVIDDLISRFGGRIFNTAWPSSRVQSMPYAVP